MKSKVIEVGRGRAWQLAKSDAIRLSLSLSLGVGCDSIRRDFVGGSTEFGAERDGEKEGERVGSWLDHESPSNCRKFHGINLSSYL